MERKQEEEEQEVGKDEITIRMPVLNDDKLIILLLVVLVCILCYAVISYIQGYNDIVLVYNEFVNETLEVCPFMFSKYDPLPILNLGNVSSINTGGFG